MDRSTSDASAEGLNMRRDCIDIAATPAEVWHALTDTAESASWYFGTGIESSYETGAAYRYAHADGTTAIEGVVERAEAPNLLAMTFHAVWNEEVAADSPTRVTWTIEATQDGSMVGVIHEDLAPGSATESEVTPGWPTLLGSLKVHLESPPS